MTDQHPKTTHRERQEPASTGEDPLETLDAEVVEDLDADEDANDVRGGTSLGCRDVH